MDEGLTKRLSKLKSIKDSARSILFVASGYSQRTALLLEWLTFIEEAKVHPELGNALILGGSLDEENLDAAVKVDEVRETLQSLSLQRWDKNQTRYVLIPHAENLTNQAFNALLKSLEEPPEGTVFVLFAPTRKSLLKTVLSRCIILNIGHSDEVLKEDTENLNPFYKAFFEKEFAGVHALTKENFLSEWKLFYKSLSSYYALRKNETKLEWFDLFSFVEKCNKRIETHTDYKWLIADIESVKEF